MKRTQLNLALLVAAAGLGVAIFLSQKPEVKGPPLTALATDAITKIRIEHPGSPALVMEKTGSGWKLLEPVQAAVDGVEINGALSLASLETQSTLDSADLKPADLGLEPPQFSVTLNDQKLEFGGTETLKYQRYVRTDGKVYLTEDPPGQAIDADYSDLISKQLLPEGAEIQRIRLPGLSIARSGDGKSWDLQPAQTASADQKQRLIDGWKGARAMWNAAQADGPLKGEEISVELKDQTIRFVVAERDPQLVLVRPDIKVRYTVSKALIEELLQLPAEKKEERPDGIIDPAAAIKPTEPASE